MRRRWPPGNLATAWLAVLCLLAAACAPDTAVKELRRGVLFYSWTHGSTLSESPQRVAEITQERVRSLREIEDFSGTLAEWRSRTEPVDRIHVGTEDYALDRNIFFYCLASLRRPAVAENLLIRITRTAPDGSETTDLATQMVAQLNRSAQSAGILYSMAGLAAGEHRLQVDVLDGNEVVAGGELWVDHSPGSGSTESLRETTS